MKAYLVQGLAFGDEGKGSVVDALVRRTGSTLVVRYNGGAQAGHNVVTPDGRHHCFAQFGAGTFAGARTFLGPHVKVDPLALAAEARVLAATLGHAPPRVLVDERAPVLTPWHRSLNRLREESRGVDRHGSCGMGIGELGDDLANGRVVIRARDLCDRRALEHRARAVHHAKLQQALDLVDLTRPEPGWYLTPEQWAGRVMAEAWPWLTVCHTGLRSVPNWPETLVLEGAQGVLLDERWGFHPHTTWGDCTFRHADALLDEAGVRERTRVGVLRAYHTRHGAGPFPTEDPALHNYDGLLRGEHNRPEPWQGVFRVGRFDAVLARYALRCAGGVDGVALTCLDRLLHGPWECAHAYAHPEWDRPASDIATEPDWQGLNYQRELGDGLRLVHTVPRTYASAAEGVEVELDVPVALLSTGPTCADKVWRWSRG